MTDYAKYADFRTYIKYRKLENFYTPSMSKTGNEMAQDVRRRKIKKLEEMYPDFREVYDREILNKCQ